MRGGLSACGPAGHPPENAHAALTTAALASSSADPSSQVNRRIFSDARHAFPRNSAVCAGALVPQLCSTEMFHENVENNFGDTRRVPAGPTAVSFILDTPQSHKRSITETAWSFSHGLRRLSFSAVEARNVRSPLHSEPVIVTLAECLVAGFHDPVQLLSGRALQHQHGPGMKLFRQLAALRWLR